MFEQKHHLILKLCYCLKYIFSNTRNPFLMNNWCRPQSSERAKRATTPYKGNQHGWKGWKECNSKQRKLIQLYNPPRSHQKGKQHLILELQKNDSVVKHITKHEESTLCSPQRKRRNTDKFKLYLCQAMSERKLFKS